MEEVLENIIDYENYKVEEGKYKYFLCTSQSDEYYGQLGFYSEDPNESDYYNYNILHKNGVYSDARSKTGFSKYYTILTEEQISKYPDDIKILDEIIKKYDIYQHFTLKADEIYNTYYDLAKTIDSTITKDYLKSLHEKFYLHVDTVKKLTEEVFGEKNVCITHDVKSNIFAAHILFEDITISNSHKKTHLIKDLVVKIPFSYDRLGDTIKVSETILGTRLTNSYSEISSNYKHSHLPSCNVEQRFSTFCLGATDVNIINTDLKVAFTESKYLLFLNMLTAYVSWESLEGGPYIKFENISARGDRYYMSSNQQQALDQIVKKKVIDFNLSFDALNKNFKVLRDTKLEGEIIKQLEDTSVKSECYCFRDVDGSEFVDSATVSEIEAEIKDLKSRIIIRPEVANLKFGNKTNPKLEIYNNITEDDKNSILSKQVIDYVANRLEANLNNHVIKKLT